MTPAPATSDRADAPSTQRQGGDADARVGRALRTVYQATVDENVPDEMMDLLNKLG